MLLSKLISKIEYTGTPSEREIDLVTCNSSQAREGALFVCIKGFVSDGHDFAVGAYRQGCRDFVTEHKIDGLPDDANIIIVKNSRVALALASAEFFGEPSKEMTVIGITGTKGKTTTALMIKHVLDAVGIPTGYIGSNGIMYGPCKIESTNTTPESNIIQKYMRSMADIGIKCVVIEVSSQALSLNRVVGVDFDICIFTNFSPDHIGENEHPNLEAYFNAKRKLFEDFSPRLVCVNADDDMSSRMIENCRSEKITYSVRNESDIKAYNISLCRTASVLGTAFSFSDGKKEYDCILPVPGEFNIYNALAAISVSERMGVEKSDMVKALADIKIDGRFEVYPTEKGASFVIDYAHNGASLAAVLLALRQYEPRKLICLFGSVGGRTRIRRSEMGSAAAKYADLSILTADNPDFESVDSIIDDIAKQFEDSSKYVRIPDRREAVKYAYSIAEKGDIVLLAGKGHEKYQLVGGKKEYFCESEILRDCVMQEMTFAGKK